MSTATTSHNNSTPKNADRTALIDVDDLDFLDCIEVSIDATETLTGDTLLGRPTSGKPCGTAANLLASIPVGEFHQLGSCPFCPNKPSPKGKGSTIVVDEKRTKITLMCWAPDEHGHDQDTVRTSGDGRTYAVWSWGPNRKVVKDMVASDDQSVLADHVLRIMVATFGLLASRNDQVMIFDDQDGIRKGGKTNYGCSPTWGSWCPVDHTYLLEFIRRSLAKLSVRTVAPDGTEGARPIRVTVRTVGDIHTLILRTLQAREMAYLQKLLKWGDITFDEFEGATSRFDFCGGTLLTPGCVLTEKAKQVIARPDHHVPSDARIGFAPDERFAAEWDAYIAQMIPDVTDRTALQMWVGAAVVGACSTKLQQHVILLGPPGTGKSQLIELIASIFPSSQRSAVPLGKLADRFSAYGLLGKRLNTSPEADTETGRLPDIGALKMILDGSQVQIERKNQQPIWTRLACAHLIAANDLPSGGAGEALYDRFRVIRATDVRIRHAVSSVAQWWTTRLHWRPAILAWAIAGLAQLDSQGWRLPKSDSSNEAMDDWREVGDAVFAWTRTLPPAPAVDARDQWTPAQAAYDHYVAWCRSEGRQPLQGAKFGARLKELAGHTRTGGRAYQISILAPADPAIAELFPARPTAEQRIADAWQKQDVAGLAQLSREYPEAARAVFFGSAGLLN